MNTESKNYVEFVDLDVYKLAKEYSEFGWQVYDNLEWNQKKIMGDQLIKSIDSVGANISEGYGRFHYLDKVRFYYNARGSLLESKHWIDLLFDRMFIHEKQYNKLMDLYNQIYIKLNALIKSQYKSKKEVK